MRGERTPLANGLLFGLVTGFFGGLFWAAIFSVPPDEALVASRWLLIVGGFLFWFFVGFLVGMFNAPRIANEMTLSGGREPSVVQRILIALGWFLYRLIVGWFVGVLATAILILTGFTLWFVGTLFFLNLKKLPSDSPEVIALASGLITGLFCCFSGAVFGALLGPRWSPSHRPSIASPAVRSSFLSFLLGLLIGASLGWLPSEEPHPLVSLVASVPISILSGILGRLWMEIHNIRRILKD